MRRHPLASYFVLAYAVSWLGWLPYVLSQSGLGLLPWHADALVLLGAFGPCASGFLMAAITGGKRGVRDLLRRLARWQVGWQWYLFVLVGSPVLLLLGFLAMPGVAATLHVPSFPFVLQVALVFLLNVVIQTCTQALGEEPGWRGFALPRLQQRYGPLLGTLILAPLWAGWHLPLFLTTAFAASTPVAFFVFVLASTGLALVFTWVFNHTQGSVLLALLLHASLNAFGAATAITGLFPASSLQQDIDPVLLVSFGSVAVLLLLVTPGRLGLSSRPE